MKHLRLPVILGFIFTVLLFTGCSGNVETDDIKTDVSQTTATYTVTVADNITGGSVTADKTTGIKAGETVTLTLALSAGYMFDSLTVTTASNTAVTTTVDSNNSKKYTFTMPESNVTVTASFKTLGYSVTFASGITNGTITSDKTTGITVGETVTLTAAPSDGYELQTLMILATASNTFVTVTINPDDSTKYSFTMPASNVTISASFKTQSNHSVTIAGNITNGSVTTNPASNIAAGAAVTLTVTPADGYELQTLKLKTAAGYEVTATVDANDSKKYTFKMPASNVTVTATFRALTYSVIVASEIPNGSVSADKTTGVTVGETVTLTVTPLDGYELQVLEVINVDDINGGAAVITTVDADDSTKYTFTMPAGRVTVRASFKVITYTVTIANGITGGSITSNKTTGVDPGETVTLTVTPSDCYELQTLTVTTTSGAAVTTTVVANNSNKYTFIMPASKVTVTASFIFNYQFHNTVTKVGTVTCNGNQYDLVYFGDFPQTIIDSTEVSVDESTSMEIGGFTYYKGSDNYWYVKCIENGYVYNTYYTYSYSNGTSVGQLSQNRTKYFKVEPIKWRVLNKNSDGTALLLAENALTANVAYYGYDKNEPDIEMTRTLNGKTIYTNNYKYSNIRAYLNGTKNQFVLDGGTASLAEEDWTGKGFLQSAFTTAAQSIIKNTVVDNSEASTTDPTETVKKASKYWCDDTTDKIFLLSVMESTTSNYGFAGCNVQDSARLRLTTDYAKANNASQSTSGSQGAEWMLRSPMSNEGCNGKLIDYTGKAYGDYSGFTVFESEYSIVPALTATYGN